jgi:hypothetical protein
MDIEYIYHPAIEETRSKLESLLDQEEAFTRRKLEAFESSSVVPDPEALHLLMFDHQRRVRPIFEALLRVSDRSLPTISVQI